MVERGGLIERGTDHTSRAGIAARAISRNGPFAGLAVLAAGLLFAVNLVAAHGLPRAEFGLLASLLGVLATLGVLFGAVQTHTAGLVAVRGPGPASRWHVIRQCLLLAVPCALGVAPVAGLLHASLIDAGAVGVCALGLFLFAERLGRLQGAERLTSIGALNVFQATLRVLAVGIGARFESVQIALLSTGLAIWIGAFAAIVVEVHAPRLAAPKKHELIHTGGPPRFLQTALLTFLVGIPTVGDVIVARAALLPAAAGSWAAVAVLGRALVFFAGIVATAAYPRFIALRARAARQLLMIQIGLLALGAVAALATLLIPGLVLRVLVGSSSASTASLLTPYTITSALVSISIVSGFYELANHRRWFIYFALPPFVLLFLLTVGAGRWVGAATSSWALVALSACLAIVGIAAEQRRPPHNGAVAS